MRRIFWLAVGLGAGSTGAILAGRWARRQTQRLAPAKVGKQAVAVAGDLGGLVKEAAAEFRRGMTEREAEVRSTLGRS